MNKEIQNRAGIRLFYNNNGELRYRIVNDETGELIYDCQGHGFSSESAALSFIYRKKIRPHCECEPLF